MSNKKIEGSYYTPKFIANYMVDLCMQTLDKNENIEVLEPSCGDGVFIESLMKNKKFIENRNNKFCGVEKNLLELNKAKNYFETTMPNEEKALFLNQDFLDFSLNCSKKFDLVIGNPPYIRKEHISEVQKEKVRTILSKKGIEIKTVYNIWIAFVVSALIHLKEEGVMCFVLPYEMLQVKYAEPITKLLFSEFDEIRFSSFDEKVFPEIEQDVIILLGIKKSNKKRITYNVLQKNNMLKPLYSATNTKKYVFDKWHWYTLDPKEIELITKLKKKFGEMNRYCQSVAGIVTGNNDFFILTPTQVKANNLDGYILPILKRSLYVKNTVRFTDNDFNDLLNKDMPSFLLDLNQIETNLNGKVEKYLKYGESLAVHKKYKCRTRDPWYKVPSIWSSEGFFFKRAHKYPKIIFNQAQVFVTDTAYRIKMRDGYDIKSLIYCFYNSLSLLHAELIGRSYGGGVLEITPNEFKGIIIPYVNINDSQFDELDEMFREGKSIDEIIDYTDKKILVDYFKISPEDVSSLRNIRSKIISNRIL